MASSSRMMTSELQIPNRWKERELRSATNTERKTVPVVYYLCRNGQLEHPHFMEVVLNSSSDGLYLKDVINRLNVLRGNGMASMYSWSSKRSYKNGFVWHDLSENDLIHPTNVQEYVLKGSERLLLLESPSLNTKSVETSSSTSKTSSDTQNSGIDSSFPIHVNQRRNQSWSSIDLPEYKVYKTEFSGESTGKSTTALDASTQTEEKRRRKKAEEKKNVSVELSRDEISPPPLDSSPETLEDLMKADGRLVLYNEDVISNLTAGNHHHLPCSSSSRMKASSVVMQLISCGAVSFKEDQGFSSMSHDKARVPRGAGDHKGRNVAGVMDNAGFAGLSLEDKEYFSGSLIETKKDGVFPSLKRSSSYNADRSSQMELGLEVKEVSGGRAKCIPRKSKTLGKKEANNGVACNGRGYGSSNNQLAARDLKAEQ